MGSRCSRGSRDSREGVGVGVGIGRGRGVGKGVRRGIKRRIGLGRLRGRWGGLGVVGVFKI